IAAEAVHAARSEGALHLEDVLHRRLRLEFETPDRGVAAAAAVADLVAPHLGWTAEAAAEEVRRFTAAVEARLRAEEAGTDAEAVAAFEAGAAREAWAGAPPAVSGAPLLPRRARNGGVRRRLRRGE